MLKCLRGSVCQSCADLIDQEIIVDFISTGITHCILDITYYSYLPLHTKITDLLFISISFFFFITMRVVRNFIGPGRFEKKTRCGALFRQIQSRFRAGQILSRFQLRKLTHFLHSLTQPINNFQIAAHIPNMALCGISESLTAMKRTWEFRRQFRRCRRKDGSNVAPSCSFFPQLVR